MSETSITLFEETNNQYFEQVHTQFTEAIYANCGVDIISVPTVACPSDPLEPAGENSYLEVILLLDETGSTEHVVHDFGIGTFPISVSPWRLRYSYQIVGNNGLRTHKEGPSETQQGEGEAEPRPGRLNA